MGTQPHKQTHGSIYDRGAINNALARTQKRERPESCMFGFPRPGATAGTHAHAHTYMRRGYVTDSHVLPWERGWKGSAGRPDRSAHSGRGRLRGVSSQ